jgi:transcriptional regulator with XRE-family HTH domain
MKLSDFKKEQNLTDDALAAIIGDCSVSALRKWFSGERIPRKDQMERIAEVTAGKVLPNDFYDVGGAIRPVEAAE